MQATRMKAAFITSFAILLGIGLSAIFQTFAWEDGASFVNQSYQTLSRLDALVVKTHAVGDSVRRLATAFSPEVAAQTGVEIDQVRQLARDLQRVTVKNTAAARFPALNGLLEQEAALFGEGIAGGSTESMFAAQQAWERIAGSASVTSAIEGIRRDQARILEQRTSRQLTILRRTRQLFGIAGGISLLLILLAAIRTNSDSRRRADIEKTLAVREEQYRQAVELAGDIIYRTDSTGRFTFINQTTLGMLHYTEKEVIGRSYLKLIRHDHRQHAERYYFRQFARRKKNSYLEFPIIDGHGRERWIGQNVQLLLDEGKIAGFQAIARDITERKRAEGELEKSRAFVERIALTTPGLLYVFDLVLKKNVFANREVVALLGYKQEEFQNRSDVLDLVHPDDRPAVNGHFEALRRALDGEVRRLEYRLKHSDGHWVWLLSRDTPFDRDEHGLVQQIVGIAQDVTARRAAQDKLAWQANFDALTGLANRHHFWTRLQSALRRASLEQSTASVCLFDIDHFKDINDRFGHAAGDEVLEAVGSIVRTELRSSDIAGRLGGDEFCFALSGTDQDEAARVAERIRERLVTQAFGVNSGSPFSVTATFGIAEWQPHLETRELMDAADRALYRAKSSGRNRVCVDV